MQTLFNKEKHGTGRVSSLIQYYATEHTDYSVMFIAMHID
jgi:hypothetical protein